MQNLYVSIRYLLVGYIFCAIGCMTEDLTPPVSPLAHYFKAAYTACYIFMMHFVTLAIFSLQQKSKTLRLAGWLIIFAVILNIWSMLAETEKQQDLIYNIAGCVSFMSGYYIVVEYSKMLGDVSFTKAKKLAQIIRKGVAFADVFFMLLLVPLILSVFPHLTHALVEVDLYIYYIVWLCFLVFLILCIIEIKKELKSQTIGKGTRGD